MATKTFFGGIRAIWHSVRVSGDRFGIGVCFVRFVKAFFFNFLSDLKDQLNGASASTALNLADEQRTHEKNK